MATRSMSLQAATPQDLETMTMSYIAQGYEIANKSPGQVTLIKKKQLNIVLLIIFIFFIWTVLPLLIYLIIYASDSDKMVTITVPNMPAQVYTGQLAPQAYSGQLPQPAYSGQLPQPVYSAPLVAPSGQLGAAPASQWINAPRSPDGFYWWDGQTWQPVPQSGQSGPMGQPPTGPMGY